MTSLANSLVGLSLLTGTNFGGLGGTTRVESRAVRAARANFTLAPITPVWRLGLTPPSAAAVLARPSLIDKPAAGRWPPDVATAFTAYRALEQLRALAAAGVSGAGDPQALDQRFAAGLGELERWMAGATGTQLTLSFGRALRRADSLALPAPVAAQVRAEPVAAARDATLAGLVGDERFTLRLSRPGATDSVSVDLAGLAQPPRLDTIANAFNQAIAALPMLGIDGQPLLKADGEVISRYESRFAVVRSGDGKWGLELDSGGIEEVALRQQNARPALLITTTQAVDGAVGPVALSRFDLPADELQRSTLATLGAIDAPATTLQRLGKDGKPPPPITAPLALAAAVTDADGFTYAVGTSSGSMGSQRSDGQDDLILIKLDSRGQQMWQRSLGTAGSATGLTIALDQGGRLLVGGTMAEGADGTRDLLVARFGSGGEELQFSRVRQLGDEQLQGMAVAGDGTTMLAARRSTGELALTRLDAAGRVIERHALAPEMGSQVRGLAFAPGGDLLLLTQSGSDALLQRYAGGSLAAPPLETRLANFAASSLAVSADGRVAAGGVQGSDGAIALIDGNATSWTALAGTGREQVDQMLFRSGDLFVAGRTDGVLGAAKSGLTDAFVARIDVASGTVEQVRQWGRGGTHAGPVAMTLSQSGDSAVHLLGFRDGTLNAGQSNKLADVTALRPGDRFGLRVNGGTIQTITIAANETAAAFAERVTRLIGRAAGKLSVTSSSGAPQLRFEPKAGQRIDLLAGPDGSDALPKLGLGPGQLITPPMFDSKAPRVTPGGHYGLDLAPGLSVRDKGKARAALDRIDNAISTVQAGFRSLYWDDTKAAVAEGPKRRGAISPYLGQQLERYRDALSRFGG